MNNKISEKELWEIVGFIKISPTRFETLKTIRSDFYMPSEIAKTTGFRITQVSNALHDLKEKNLVYCMNEEATKGRLYKNTPLGLEVLDIIENNKKS
ncbi:MarR family transcriptional regulator [Methanobrevibacter sp.]|uniref:MarR family transcriptional regulator n=1 Tax=Methanobrevibacter sp. TaxID=66852 RepID=UPI003866DBE7